MTVNERVCRNVKALCKMNHVALGDLEGKLGKNPGFFSRRCNVSPDMMIEIASYFEMTLDDLMKLDFEKVIEERADRDSLDDAVYRLSKRWRKDEMMKYLIGLVNQCYDD